MTSRNRLPLAGVLGWPIAHTRSPRLHRHWLARHGIEGDYISLGIEPRDFESAFQSLPLLGFRGVNVTIPHKETVLRFATKVSDRAALIGAANTITFREDGSIYADNTDGYGFLENLRAGAPGWKGSDGPALVLGAGGAARAVISALLSDGAPEIRLANRTRSRADFLADQFGAKVRTVDWLHVEDAMDGVATIVNTTALGMTGQQALPFSLKRAPRTALVNDIVYAPLITPLLEEAQSRRMRWVDGLGMLLHQGRPGFEAWYGVAPEVDEDLRAAMLAD
ncbi:shikimate dehydrogenase [Albimonas donghaensis]|uniref:Shikimate dehydrogenase (NADP(+)) n=1 Tax=Albimonas donghaensis TaxID=356660 RepID=A0A1H2Z338_9RHOB|nr:shikimate dehydrogenase [Albimonas donghaensis]MAS43907.1 shikimate dehydrogenase [Paracoccaceae bacterium]MBR27636.1 shikimate dehydrogenase [Paracoccaceae bacterium]SDX11304.1 shikimate dehydrogenase [Albimonas donghaensis]